MQRLICKITFLIFLLSVFCLGQNASNAGSFARIGFGSRGMAMGNSLSAITTGEISTYYNPALSSFSTQRTATTSFSILALDRVLNFLSYTQNLKPTAGMSIGLINSGVKNIDGRNSDGIHTQDYSTFENQFYLSFSNKVDPRVSIGIAVKLYYSKLFEKVTSTTVGFDIGACVQLTDALTVGLIIQDLGSKYRWDTNDLYPQPYGRSTTDKFPTLRRIAIAYTLPNRSAVASAEFENSSSQMNILRCGVEYNIIKEFSLRSGIDRIDFSKDAINPKPSLGFSIKKTLDGWTPTLNYGFVIEPYSPYSIHIISISANF